MASTPSSAAAQAIAPAEPGAPDGCQSVSTAGDLVQCHERHITGTRAESSQASRSFSQHAVIKLKTPGGTFHAFEFDWSPLPAENRRQL